MCNNLYAILEYFSRQNDFMNRLLKITLSIILSVGLLNSGVAAPLKNMKSTVAVAPEKEQEQVTKSGNTRDIDRVVAVVNTEIITQQELNERVRVIKKQFIDAKRPLPADKELYQQVLERLVLERVQAQDAKSHGNKVLDSDLDNIINNIATQKKMTLEQFEQSIEKSGVKWTRYKEELRNDVLITRYREREVDSKIKVSDSDVEGYLMLSNSNNQDQSTANPNPESIHFAQILVPVNENATEFEITQARDKAQKILVQASNDKDFITLMNRLGKSDPTIRAQDLGLRTIDRLPQLFVDAVPKLNAGDLLPEVLKSPAGFHILKVIDRKGAKSTNGQTATSNSGSITVVQNEVRHLLINVHPGQNNDDVVRRLSGYRDQIRAKVADFGTLAKKYSEDAPTAVNNGYIGWISPGQLMPEFEHAVAKLNIGEISDPVRTDFGWHLIQLINRKQTEYTPAQQKEFARATLRQNKLDQAYQDWIRELRDGATIELREPYAPIK